MQLSLAFSMSFQVYLTTRLSTTNTRPLELNAIVDLCQTKAFNGPGGHITLKYHPLPRRK